MIPILFGRINPDDIKPRAYLVTSKRDKIWYVTDDKPVVEKVHSNQDIVNFIADEFLPVEGYAWFIRTSVADGKTIEFKNGKNDDWITKNEGDFEKDGAHFLRLLDTSA